MFELPRKHGPFDRRYPVSVKLAAAAWAPVPGKNDAAPLGWAAFLARYYPGCRRHDRAALAAYEAYTLFNAAGRCAGSVG